MIRNLKMLGLAISAMLVLGATASVASAAEFHSEAAGTGINGAQGESSDRWAFDAGKVECEEATASGSISGVTAETLTEATFYSGCTSNFGVSITVDMNGCVFVWGEVTMTVELACPAGKVFEITNPGCTITLPSQSGMNGVTYHNKGTGKSRDTEGTMKATNVKYEEHNKGFFPTCKNNTVAKSNGTYERSVTFHATSGGEQVGFWYE